MIIIMVFQFEKTVFRKFAKSKNIFAIKYELFGAGIYVQFKYSFPFRMNLIIIHAAEQGIKIETGF